MRTAEPERVEVLQERHKSAALVNQAAPALSADGVAANAEQPLASQQLSELKQALRRLLLLRQGARQDEAQRLLEQLQADYRHLDLEAELARVQAEEEAAGGGR